MVTVSSIIERFRIKYQIDQVDIQFLLPNYDVQFFPNSSSDFIAVSGKIIFNPKMFRETQ